MTFAGNGAPPELEAAMPDLIDAYLDRLALKNFSEHTIRAYRGDLRQAEAAVGAPLVKVEDWAIEAYASGLSRKLKPTTVRRKQAALRGFFEHAQRVKARLDDPTKVFEAPKLEERLPIYLNDLQISTVLESLGGDTPRARREAALFCCLYYTGMRAGELVGLDVELLDFGARELRVYGKGKKERTLPLSAHLATALRAWLEVRPGPPGGPLFVRLEAPHGRLGYDAVAEVVKGVFKRAGLAGRKFSCHKLRHTFATRLVNRKVSIDKIQKLLGHRKLETTTIYTHTALGSDLIDELDGAL
jgi:site-specific recombinase XerD